MYIPNKFLLKSGDTLVNGSLGLKCSQCGAEFAIPPDEITADLATATICEACAAAAEAAALNAVKPDLEHTGSMV